MEVTGKRYIVYSERDAVIRLTAISDVHLFNRGCSEDKLQADINAVADNPYNYWLSLGDLCDWIGIGDKRFDPEAVAFFATVRDLGNLGTVGRDTLVERFRPIHDRCLGVGVGNHELSYMRHQNQQRLIEDMADMMGTWYLGYSSFTDVVMIYSPQSKGCPKLVRSLSDVPKGQDHFTVRVYTHHGHGYARSQGGKMNKLVDFMRMSDADITFCGHLHDQIIKTIVRLRSDPACNRIIAIPQIGVMTGSYLRTYAQGHIGYGEVKAYDPTPLGAVSVDVIPAHRRLTARVSIEPYNVEGIDAPDYEKWIEAAQRQEGENGK